MHQVDDQRDDPKIEHPRRIEILTGAGDRRRWPDDLKARIVVESLAPGVIVTALARCYGARASQIHTWRKDAREGRLALAPPTGAFAPVMIAAAPGEEIKPVRMPARAAAMVEIDDGAIHVRIRQGCDERIVTALVRALKTGA